MDAVVDVAGAAAAISPAMIDRLARRYLQARGIARKPALVQACAQALFDALWDAGFRRAELPGTHGLGIAGGASTNGSPADKG